MNYRLLFSCVDEVATNYDQCTFFLLWYLSSFVLCTRIVQDTEASRVKPSSGASTTQAVSQAPLS